MGSYFEIDNEYQSSKQKSGILINAIKELEYNPQFKEYGWFIPMKDGNWKITRNGIAVLLYHYAIEENKEDLEDKIEREHLSEDEIKKKIKEYEEDIDEDIQWIIVYLSRILCNMTLDKRRIVYGRWR